MSKFYPVATPILNGNEKEYVLDCLNSNWISSSGVYIDKFEQNFARFCGTQHAVSCINGTAALHLALLAHGVQPGDEVIIPTLTFVATANAVIYCGAKPVFIDSEEESWNIDPNQIEKKITTRTKGIIVVHIYGHPVDMDPIMNIAKKHGLFVVEDAAEAIGAEYKGKKVGSIGHSATFSLFGNKIITTGEGGMVTTNDPIIAENVRFLRSQGQDTKRKYWFPLIGFNYRMTNIQAAIGCGQLENIHWHIDQRIRVANLYYKYLKESEKILLPTEKEWAKNVFWMYSVVFKDFTEQMRDMVMKRLKDRGIETRPFFYPMHVLPPYISLQPYSEFPVANRLTSQGINIPSFGSLTESDILYISNELKNVIHSL